MITNIPTPEGLDNAALQLYFSGWDSIIGMQLDFDRYFETDESGIPDAWQDEWTQYVDACQSDLQRIYTFFAQSNELALKARLCRMSPFLLLLKGDPNFSTSNAPVDFTEFRTIDAADLPGAVNTFCDRPLSPKFIQTYNQVRSIRNKITHLGSFSTSLELRQMTIMMVEQYLELWPDRKWLSDRLKYASETRRAYFHDQRYASAEYEVLAELSETFRRFTGGQFKKLFGHSKTKRRYICHHCYYQAELKMGGPDVEDCGTCILVAKSKLACLMCEGEFDVVRQKCMACPGDVIAANSDDFDGMCHSCRHTVVDEDTPPPESFEDTMSNLAMDALKDEEASLSRWREMMAGPSVEIRREFKTSAQRKFAMQDYVAMTNWLLTESPVTECERCALQGTEIIWWFGSEWRSGSDARAEFIGTFQRLRKIAD